MKVSNPENLKKTLQANKINGALLYGLNNGYIFKSEEIIHEHVKATKEIIEFKSIAENEKYFKEKINNKDLFFKKKIFIIKGVKKTDKLNEQIIKEIENLNSNSFFLLVSYEQSVNNSIKKAFENSKKLLCVAHYPENRSTSISIIENCISRNNLEIDRDGKNKIFDKLCFQDRSIIESEIKKLSKFKKNPNSEEIEGCISKIISDNCYASDLFESIENKEKIIRLLLKKLESNNSAIQIINMLLNYCKKLKDAKFLERTNMAKEFILNNLQIHFSVKKTFLNHCANNSEEKINSIMYNLINLELLCKKNSKIQSQILINKFFSMYNNEQ